jgi:SpoVK/Ycf46/Vps4 family AAA+-type ATPase
MAAAEQIKSLIQSFADDDETRFYATAMQIAAAEARKGNEHLAHELKRLIDKAKASKKHTQGLVKAMPVNAAQKELSDLLELVHPKEQLKDMVLDLELKRALRRILDEQQKLEILLQHNLFPRKKLLFTGPPGCGKTMSARVIAYELGLPLFIIRLDGLISRYMGESIAKLRLIFDAMHQFRAVYLFDEFDSIGTTRSASNDVGEIKRILNSFLLQIEKDDSNSLIIAATNLPNVLDTALLRRFDDILIYKLPNENEIFKFYKLELSDFNLSKRFDLKRISKESIGLSYADIHRICEDLEKDLIVYGSDEISEERLLSSIKHRKKPF